MKNEKEHKKSTLMSWTKEQLAEYAMCLEHNNNSLNESLNIQYTNIMNVLDVLEINGIKVSFDDVDNKIVITKIEGDKLWK